MSILEPKMDMVCTEVPLGCKTTSTFLVNRSHLSNSLDVRANEKMVNLNIMVEEKKSLEPMKEMFTTLKRSL